MLKSKFGGITAEIESEDCQRHRVAYRNENLYITVSPTRVDLSMANIDEFRTLAGIALIERLINELLDLGMNMDDIAGICFESSYQTGDLPELLSKVLDGEK